MIGPTNSPYNNKAIDVQVLFDEGFPTKAPMITIVRQAHTGYLPAHEVYYSTIYFSYYHLFTVFFYLFFSFIPAHIS